MKETALYAELKSLQFFDKANQCIGEKAEVLVKDDMISGSKKLEEIERKRKRYMAQSKYWEKIAQQRKKEEQTLKRDKKISEKGKEQQKATDPKEKEQLQKEIDKLKKEKYASMINELRTAEGAERTVLLKDMEKMKTDLLRNDEDKKSVKHNSFKELSKVSKTRLSKTTKERKEVEDNYKNRGILSRTFNPDARQERKKLDNLKLRERSFDAQLKLLQVKDHESVLNHLNHKNNKPTVFEQIVDVNNKLKNADPAEKTKLQKQLKTLSKERNNNIIKSASKNLDRNLDRDREPAR